MGDEAASALEEFESSEADTGIDLSSDPDDVRADSNPPDPVVEPPGAQIPSCEELTGSNTVPRGHEPGQESTIFFQDVTSAVGLPAMYTPTISAGDVNADGHLDLFVAGWVSERLSSGASREPLNYSLFFGCSGMFYEYRIDDAELGRNEPNQPNASHIADMDSDGLVDLVVGYQGSIHILYQHADGGFEHERVWARSDRYYEFGGTRNGNIVDLTIADFDQDGKLDIYASHYGGVNPLLQGLDGRVFIERAFETQAHAEATGLETYASAVIPPVSAEDPHQLFLAHHAEFDQVWAIQQDFQLALVVDQIPTFASMGVDYYYRPDDQGIVVLASDTRGRHFYLLTGQEAIPLVHRNITDTDVAEWGIQLGDFDNDSHFDAVIPTGERELEIAGPIFRMYLAVHDAEASEVVEGLGWRDQSATAGSEFDGSKLGNYNALLSADFDLDGCVDLFVAPMSEYGRNPISLSYSSPVQLLRNRCGYPGNWVGFHLDDPGALISITINHLGDEMVRRADVQAGSGIGCDGASEQVHIGLGPADEILRGEVRCASGQAVDITAGDLHLNRYNELGHLCPLSE